jgi:hypothetical protein
MGTNENSIIQVKEDLSKKPGDSINFALVNKLTNDAITGRNVLEGNEEDMVSRSFDTSMMQAQREVRLEVQNSKLFEGGDLIWDGCIIKETPDLDQFYTSNATPVRCGPVILCGAQAVGAAYAKRWTTKTKEFDYGDKFGIATESIYGIKKLEFGTGANDTDTLKDNGVVTGWFAAVADA